MKRVTLFSVIARPRSLNTSQSDSPGNLVGSLAILLLDVNTFDLDQIRESEERICLDILGRGKIEKE